MATQFPIELDNFTNPTSGSLLDDPLVKHSDQHINTNDALEAIQARIGITGSLDFSSIDFQLHNINLGHNHDGINSRPISLGPAGVCDYQNGLFETFNNDTAVGEAVCKINEVLKGLAPPPAPSLTNLSVTNSGLTGRLSFGSQNTIPGYTNVSGSVGNFPIVDVNGLYQVSDFSGDLVRGLFNNSTTISGFLNSQVVSNLPNYPAGAFGNADSGEIRVFINGALEIVADLTSTTGSFAVATANGSFVSLSALSTGSFDNGNPFDLFKHRTGTYSIAPNDQRNGWNHIRIVHRTIFGNPASDVQTNWASWVVDGDNSGVTAANASLHSLNLTGLKYLTGVKYFTAGTALYDVDIVNAYTNAYSNGNAVTFGGSTNISFSAQALSPITGSETQNKIELIKNKLGTLNNAKLLPGTITARVNCTKPIGANLVNGGASSIGQIFLNSQAANSTLLVDNFRDEIYRLEPLDYDLQADATSNDFNSQTDRTGSIELPLVVFNEALNALPQLPDSGNGNGDFSGFANGPSGNVDYSGFSGNLNYYRRFVNNTGGARSNFNIILNGNGTIVTSSAGLGANNSVFIEVKLPEKTGWNVLLPFQLIGTPQIPDDGAGILNGPFNQSLNATNACTFGTVFLDNGEHIIMRVTTNAQWSGRITRLEVQWTS
jgi:hypothetical protein